jgi:uncharacterized protein (TIGR02391 family)
MGDSLESFERITRSVWQYTSEYESPTADDHPLESRNIHPVLPVGVRKLFDDGHYSQSTFEAFKFVDKEVARLANSSESGFKLMMAVMSEASPNVKLTACGTVSEKDEQKGFQFLFAGSMLAVRNPRGHEYAVHDSPDECLDHLALASMLLRRLQAAGYTLKV